MNSTLSPLRSLGATLVIAGVVSFGAVAVAPAASAAPVGDGSVSTASSDSTSGRTAAGRAEQVLSDAVERRERVLDRLLDRTAPAPTTPAPATPVAGEPKPCTMSLPANALENIGCVVDPTAPRF